jgi:hypothetical protein
LIALPNGLICVHTPLDGRIEDRIQVGHRADRQVKLPRDLKPECDALAPTARHQIRLRDYLRWLAARKRGAERGHITRTLDQDRPWRKD